MLTAIKIGLKPVKEPVQNDSAFSETPPCKGRKIEKFHLNIEADLKLSISIKKIFQGKF